MEETKTAEAILESNYNPNPYDVREAAEMGRGMLYTEKAALKAMEEFSSQEVSRHLEGVKKELKSHLMDDGVVDVIFSDYKTKHGI